MILRLPITILKILAWMLVILIPTLGVWVASSLAAYLNGPIWLACLAGLLLFPVLPLAWDLWATNRFLAKQEARKAANKEPGKRIVTFGDRMILRTFFLNIGFLAALLATFPQAGFTALATRGDWVLETAEPATAQRLRPILFSSAEGLAWLYEWSREDPYAEFKSDEPLPTPKADEFGDVEARKTPPEPPVEPSTPEPPKTPESPDSPEPVVEKPVEIVGVDDAVRKPGEPPAWPMKAELHRLVQGMPAAVETDYASVALYIKENEPDPFLRVKALNDYVANRLAYDHVALRTGDFPSQDAKDVFDRKLAVCAGYARLMVAMGKLTGDEIVYVRGVSRDQNGGVSGGGHAWNAAKIEGKWYLVDTTWNDGDVEVGEDHYSTNYLFTPPAVFGADHLPNEEVWQLRSDPLTRGDFMRQPILPPEFHAQRLELISPKRSQIEATGDAVEVTLNNPLAHRVIASTAPVDGGTELKCTVKGRTSVVVTCPVKSGKYKLQVFAGQPELTWYPMVAQFEVTSR